MNSKRTATILLVLGILLVVANVIIKGGEGRGGLLSDLMFVAGIIAFVWGLVLFVRRSGRKPAA
ncbi:MAG: hypothetical protein HYX99_04730 [Chloroflexi bacterium]|nr:hypothetical protein [Chloroflexota bacterium]